MAHCNFKKKEILLNIAILGAPSAGKSTYIRALKNQITRKETSNIPSFSMEPFLEDSPLEMISTFLGYVGGYSIGALVYTLDAHSLEKSLSYLKIKSLDGAIYLLDCGLNSYLEQKSSFDLYNQLFVRTGRNLSDFPVNLYYNKRDQGKVMPISGLDQDFNQTNWPYFSGSTNNHIDTEKCFKHLVARLLGKLSRKNRENLSYEI